MSRLPSEIPSSARYVGRIIIPKLLPDGRVGLVDVWSDTVDTYITAPSQKNVVRGRANHSDECAPRVNNYDRIHTVSGVRDVGVGLGTALYVGAALAREFRGSAGVFSIPLSQKRSQTRSTEAEAVWDRLRQSRSGRPPIAEREQAEIEACSGDDFTPAEKRTKAWKRWESDEDSEAPFYVKREVDFLAGQTVRERGFVVDLAKVERTTDDITQEYATVLPKLTDIFSQLSEDDQAKVEGFDTDFHAGKPDAFIRWARTVMPSAFPPYGTSSTKAPWASFTPPPPDVVARTVSAAAPLSSASLGMLAFMDRMGAFGR